VAVFLIEELERAGSLTAFDEAALLYKVVWQNQRKPAEVLLSFGASPNVPVSSLRGFRTKLSLVPPSCPSDETAMHAAERLGFHELVTLLHARGGISRKTPWKRPMTEQQETVWKTLQSCGYNFETNSF
jgi:hypothetical protein